MFFSRRMILSTITIFSAILLAGPLNVAAAGGKTISESEFLASRLLGEEIAIWVNSHKNKINSIAVFVVRATPPLDSTFADVLETEVFKSIKKEAGVIANACRECKAPTVKVDGSQLVITRGLPDDQALQDISKRLGADALLTIQVGRTGTLVHAHATIYAAGSADVVGAESFRVPSIDISGAGTQIVLMAAPGITIGGSDNPDESTPPISGNIMILEELGFGKAGITTGAIITKENGNLAYLMPTIGWRGRLFGGATQTLSSVALGYAVGKAKSGVLVRAAYDLFVGTFTNIGLEAAYLVPVSKRSDEDAFDGFLGLHLGISFGR